MTLSPACILAATICSISMIALGYDVNRKCMRCDTEVVIRFGDTTDTEERVSGGLICLEDHPVPSACRGQWFGQLQMASFNCLAANIPTLDAGIELVNWTA